MTDGEFVIESGAPLIIQGSADAAPDSTLVISNKGDDLVTFDMATGEMTFGSTYTPEGAAKVFWEAMAQILDRRIRWVEEGKCWMCGQDVDGEQ
jgi:hypothetical protein